MNKGKETIDTDKLPKPLKKEKTDNSLSAKVEATRKS